VHGLAGQLGGSIYGRCCDVAVITDGSAVTAVNAVLTQLCNLVCPGDVGLCTSLDVCPCLLRREYNDCFAKAPPGTLVACCEHGMQGSTVIVSSRPAAQRVVEHYASKRVGLVQCKIVDETCSRFVVVSAKRRASAAGHSAPQLCAVPPLLFLAGVSTCRQTRQPPADTRPLVACIGSKTDDDQALKPLRAMLGSWALVADRKGILLCGHASGSFGSVHAPLGRCYQQFHKWLIIIGPRACADP
jgi:hypothetical protein